MNANLRPCPVCGEVFTGRADKRFCSNTCRATNYNSKHSIDSASVKRVNRMLSNNRRVLKMLNKQGTTKIDRYDLVYNGFNFDLVTSVSFNKNNQMYKYCYEQGYLELGENKVLLVTLK